MRLPSPLLPLGRAARSARRAARRLRPTTDPQARPLYIGWTRYSALAERKGGLGLSLRYQHKDEDAYRAQLWAADRMADRSQMFLTLSVPLLQAMKERHAYRHVVTYSPEMPDPWLSQLHEAADRYDVLDLRPVSAGAPVEALRDHLLRVGGGSRPAVWFRVDDDDLLPVNFLDLLDEHVRHVGPGWAISLGMGYEGLWWEGRVHHLRRRHRPSASHGQAFSGWWDADTQQLTVPAVGNHRTVDRRSPTVLDSRTLAWVRLIHRWQDTKDDDPTFESLAAPLLRNPMTVRDEDDLRRWPTLDGSVLHPEPDASS